jgi:hypothetical protein
MRGDNMTTDRTSASHAKITLLIAIGLVVTLGPLPGAGATDPPCVPGTGVGACAFTGAETGGVYVYDTITIPAGVTIDTMLPIVLHARQQLTVEGNIVHSPLITLVSDQVASIRGVVHAQDGAAPGGRGGDVKVVASLLEISGTLQSGDGAPGLDQTMSVGDALPSIAALGTPGGQGGNVVVTSPSASITGLILLGNGGKGGTAIALGGTQAASATGGAGGASGVLALPPTFDPLSLHAVGVLLGGRGGDGGDAMAAPSTVAVIGDPGSASAVDDTDHVACSGQPGNGAGAKGTGGCYGGSSQAQAGKGGDGILIGGNGGKASAFGGHGGPGGVGGAGQVGGGPGGPGGVGGWGGEGAAWPGDGGSGLVQGGDAGDAQAYGGQGGVGGNGGAGWFDSRINNCTDSGIAYCGVGGRQCWAPGGAEHGGDAGDGWIQTAQPGASLLQPGHAGGEDLKNGEVGPWGQNGNAPAPICGPPPQYFYY